VARLGGDEFVMVLSDIGHTEKEATGVADMIGKKLLALLNQPHQLGNVTHVGGACIGITLFKGDGATPDVLLKQADLAMYKSKDSGRNVCRFFDPQMETSEQERETLDKELRQALVEQQFALYYQPQVGPDGELTGAEALVRWVHPKRGVLLPGEFIPSAEESGFILPLGQWILESACRQLAEWGAQPMTAKFRLAVNVSASQFRQGEFVDQLVSMLRSTGADPNRLTLELTEGVLLHNVDDVIEKMSALKQLGINFALDDFGTGYSSLYYLKRLPLDQMKIDRSFVRDVLTDPGDAAIAKTIVALAHTLGLDVIAEGVETAEQRTFLANAGCQHHQGYLFSRPLPIHGFERFAWQGEPIRPLLQAIG
jgi:EAL domain-containing protein (putative c-di-GMP-specific phosphodiesterase class I)